MFDKEFVLEILTQIHGAILRSQKRFVPILSADDFTNSESGMEKLDAICMQLIAIGESLKKIDNVTEKKLLKKYSEIDWKRVKGLRDIISHHYFDVDAEVIYDVCENHLDMLRTAVEKMMADL